MSLDEQRVLAGIVEWDRRTLSEGKSRTISKTRSKTAGYIQQAMERLNRAQRASRHRKLRMEHPMYSSLQQAVEACQRAYEACYRAGEAYDGEADTDE